MDQDNIRRILLDLIFPNRCPLCGKVIHWSLDYCEGCYRELPKTGDELCRGCGNVQCTCREDEPEYLRCYPAFYYDGSAKSAVIYLKKTKNYIFPRMVAEKIVSDIFADKYNFKIDCIVPVPMTKGKLRKRGFNQAEVIAEAIAELLDVPVEADVILKKKSFKEQHTLSSFSRKRNAEQIYFKTDSDAVKDKTVLLCDDVTTTGSTLNKCAKVLVEMGATAVVAAAAATTIK